MDFVDDSLSRLRTKRCRHCGELFETYFPAQQTCKRPECRKWAEERVKGQRRKADAKYKALRRNKWARK